MLLLSLYHSIVLLVFYSLTLCLPFFFEFNLYCGEPYVRDNTNKGDSEYVL